MKVSQQQVSRYENGKTQLTIVKINQYLTVFGLSWGDFLEGLNKEKDVIYSNTNLH
ncbi:helix-turn-helix transcriptional regulator [Moellerella wisconsensis]|uniref:helix-turn-helix domain-containing protein n=1 Tax=Moellerella wisconsensis TaxID=158849 RepID=UPI0025B2806F|nr:helix-turn-helix transcriptional regulator [Moellerella wisconsensis]WJW83263.1 helix-turn-helix transcriptional regulator [Moellerella wisconsensis]